MMDEPVSMSIVVGEEEMKQLGNDKMSIDDFKIKKVIGKGSYGKVLLVVKDDDKKIYAMKVLKKKNMIKRNQVDHIKTERRIMELMDHPFIIKLRYAFQNEKKLYLVMDYCPGGELFFHIQRVNRFNEDAVKFYSAQLLLAINHLHKNNIIYRDLKPENVLIDMTGYIKLADFGLSKENIQDNHSANSFCGTPEYLAPEIVENKGHGKAADWWSLGAIIYEMLTGLPPFYSKDREKLFRNIKSATLNYPEYLSKNCVSLLEGLFAKNPDSRLGSGDNGFDNLIAHPFFKGINWEMLLNKKINPPFTPRVTSEADTKYVDKEFTSMTPIDSFTEDSLRSQENKIFIDFSYENQKKNISDPQFDVNMSDK